MSSPSIRWLACSAVLVGTALTVPAALTVHVAAAAPRQWQPGDDGQTFTFERTGPANGVQFARQVLPPTAGASTPSGDIGAIPVLAQSRVIYLNKAGVQLRPGNANDARNNISTIAAALVNMPAWNPPAQLWTDTVTCMQDMFKRFNVQIVTTDPGNVPHIEAVFTDGTMATLDASVPNANQIGGVSPFTQDCSIIENSVVFTFTSVMPQNAQVMCEVMAQEIVHSYGADHELLPADPMTYLQYSGKRSFQDVLSDCGESSVRPCGIGGSTCRNKQNSVALLRERVGTANSNPPVISNVSPSTGTTVPPGFTVTVAAMDNVAVTKVEVLVDGIIIGSKTSAPWTFPTSATLVDGSHEVTVHAYDDASTTSQSLELTVQKGAPQPPGGAGGGAAFGNDDYQGGCASNGGGATALVGLFVLGLIVGRKRQ